MKLRLLISVFIHLVFAGSLLAQQNHLYKGVVKNDKGENLEGVTVTEKGTSNATVTKLDGSFSIKSAKSVIVLVFTSAQFSTQELKSNAKQSQNITVLLKEKVTDLDDVVVIAYGTTSKKLVSGAVSSLAGKEIENLPVASTAEALAGRISGVTVSTPTGEPGVAPYFRVRGLGSIGAGNSPLFVIDGYPVEGSAAFNNINPADIESVQVLKDAASTAIYGSRGGNGIVLVTTKKGAGNKFKFTVSSYLGFQNPSKKIELLDPQQFGEYAVEAYANAGRSSSMPVIFKSPEMWVETDWQNEIFNTGLQQNVHVSASGGNNISKTYVSGSYFKQEGLVKNSGYERYTVRTNYTANLTSKLKFGLALTPSYTKTDVLPVSGTHNSSTITGGGPSGVGSIITDALMMLPILPVTVENGDYMIRPLANGAITFNGLLNPIATREMYRDAKKGLRLTGASYLEYEILKNLRFKTTLGTDISTERRNWYVPATLASNNYPEANLSNPVLANINARHTSSSSYNWMWENTLSYSKEIGRHTIGLLAGYSAQRNTVEGDYVYGLTGSYTSTDVEFVTGAGQIMGSASYAANALTSAFGRLDYNFDSKYILSAALRTDGSSRFGTDVKYATFPSLSAAWRMKEESFLRNVKWLSELKVRASYGVTGNNNIGDYSWQAYQTAANYVLGSGNGAVVYGFTPNSVAIKDLSWEKNTQSDIGVEVGLFKNRINISADLYQRKTTSLLLNRNVPGVIGFATRIFSNVGEVSNKGFEIAVESRNIMKKNFKWTTSANYFINRNRVIALAGKNDELLFDAIYGYTSSIRVVAGHPMGSFYGYKKLGVYMNADDLANSPKMTGAKVGDLKFEDVSGPHGKPDGVIDSYDITNIGHAFPKYSFGITNRFNIYRFTASFLIQGAIGGKVLNGIDRLMNLTYGRTNVPVKALERWRSEENPGDGQTPRVSFDIPASITAFSSHMLYDASYVRIRNVQVSYDVLSAAAKKKTGINSASIYVQANNLYTFTKYFGYNPEANLYGNSTNPTYGVDQGSYPLARTITVGFNLSF
jgi:TonB-linked SusC/RagA family outer membrane protein